jgi:hypothetical protein
LTITSPSSGGSSVGIVRSRTQTIEFFFTSNPEDDDNGNFPTKLWKTRITPHRAIFLKTTVLNGRGMYFQNLALDYSYLYKAENTAVGIRHAEHVAPSIPKIWH